MTQTVSIRLDEQMVENLDKLAQITDRSRAWLMNYAVEQYIQREMWQIEAMEQSLLKLRKGEAQFIDHQMVSHWLEQWGTTTEGTKPLCK